MRPLQLWLPTFGHSIWHGEVARDTKRAFAAWRMEEIVYLLPGVKQEARWCYPNAPSIYCLAVPSEHLDLVGVYHIGENGFVWGDGSHVRFPGSSINGLLESFINAVRDERLVFYEAPQVLAFNLPQINKDRVTYEEVTVYPRPGPSLTITGVDDEGCVTVQWPPPGETLCPISIAAESTLRHGPLEWVQGSDSLVVSQRDPNYLGMHVLNKWLGPLEGLFPYGGGVDDLFGLAKMTRIAECSAHDLPGALKEAQDVAAPYLSQGTTTVEYAWFWPSYLAARSATVAGRPLSHAGALDAAIVDMAYRYGMPECTFREAKQAPEWRRLLGTPVPIRRVWGPLGLFWALFLERLEAGQVCQVCERCGRIVQGRRGKRFCGPEDNGVCFGQRRTEDQRRSRLRRRTRTPGNRPISQAG